MPVLPLKWYQYADPTLAPLWRSRRGSITPIRHWFLYADHRLAPMCRSVTLRAGPFLFLAERVGFEHFGRSMRISMLPILQGISSPGSPLESPYSPLNLPPALFPQVRSSSGCEHAGAMGLTRFHTSSDIAFLQTMQSVHLLFNPTKSTTSRSPLARLPMHSRFELLVRRYHCNRRTVRERARGPPCALAAYS
jgi:hypothetical protein